MSYDPTNWKAGDVISSQKLNKLEQGVADAGGGGGNLVVTITKTEDGESVTYTADKTAGEIKAAMESGQGVAIPFTMQSDADINYKIAKVGEPNSVECEFVSSPDVGYVLGVAGIVLGEENDVPMFAATLDDYPSATSGK